MAGGLSAEWDIATIEREAASRLSESASKGTSARIKPAVGLAWDVAAIVAAVGALVVVAAVAMLGRWAARAGQAPEVGGPAASLPAASVWDLAVMCAAGGAVAVVFLVLLVQVQSIGKHVARAEETAMSALGPAADGASTPGAGLPASLGGERGVLRSFAVRMDIAAHAELKAKAAEARTAFPDETLPTFCNGKLETVRAVYNDAMWLVLGGSEGGDRLLDEVARGSVRYAMIAGAVCRVALGRDRLSGATLKDTNVARVLAAAPAYSATALPVSGPACAITPAVLPMGPTAPSTGTPRAFADLKEMLNTASGRELGFVVWAWG